MPVIAYWLWRRKVLNKDPINVSWSRVDVPLRALFPVRRSFILEKTLSQEEEAAGIENICLARMDRAGNLF